MKTIYIFIYLLCTSTSIAQWSVDPRINNPVCTAPNAQINPVAVSDGIGGIIIAWEDYRYGNPQIFAQKIDRDGHALWGINGIQICATSFQQNTPVITTDGGGGAIIAWSDLRDTLNIYAQHVNTNGELQWQSDGVRISYTEFISGGGPPLQEVVGYPLIMDDGMGGAIIIWRVYSYSGSEMLARRISTGGNLQWDSEKFIHFSRSFLTIKALRDISGGMDMAYFNSWPSNGNLCLSRIDTSGTVYTGIIGETGLIFDFKLDVSNDNLNNIFIIYNIPQNYGSILAPPGRYLQRCDTHCVNQWPFGGILLDSINYTGDVTVTTDNRGGVITCGDSVGHYFAQRYDQSGVPQWMGTGVEIAIGGDNYRSISDGSGGAIVTWTDMRNGNGDIYAQRINNSGIKLWNAAGIPISTALTNQNVSCLVTDGNGGAIVVWVDMRNDAAGDIYAQRLYSDGRLGDNEPRITSIRDIPNDQGGEVRLIYTKSPQDTVTSLNPIIDYGVWRKIPPSFRGKGGTVLKPLNDTLGVMYDLVATVPAIQSPQYNLVINTLGDSSASGIPWFKFLVTAHTANPFVYGVSQVDSGYSVDNLSPSIVTGLSAIVQSGPKVQLNWNLDTIDSDVAHYDVYRSTASGFIPNPTLRIGTSIGGSFLDTLPISGKVNYYRVITVDIHENESLPSTQVQATITITNASNMFSGWNLVSLPLNVSDNRKVMLFPTAASNAYIYRGAYLPQDTINSGIGFWLKFNSEQAVQISGLPNLRDTVNVAAGWNIIGSISTPITSVTSIPPNIRTSNFFGYSGIYKPSDTIYPGRGYWAKFNQPGKLILAANSSEVSVGLIKILPTAELPPQPPGEEMSTAERAIPTEYALDQAYPSPFNPATTIKYQLPEDSRVSLLVYNTLGQAVVALVDGVQQAGYKQVEWNAGNIPSGVYFYRLETTAVNEPTNIFTETRKALLLK